MPLPKTATIAARATEVYCEAWSVILQRISKMPPTRESDLNDLSQLLPYLRQLLTCCACAGLLDNAMISLTCGHCYCFECQFREPLLKIQCRQCRERTGLVMESQLQLIVNCYKHMCQIIGEELRRNPCALDVIPEKDEEPQVICATTAETKLNISVKLPSEGQEESGKAGIVPEKEAIVLSKKTAVTVGDPKKKITVTVEDPIGEIVREVEKGTKVSRAILWIKPPHKYLNNKVPVTPRVVAKKDAPAPANAPLDKTAKEEPSVECESGQCCPDAEAQQNGSEPVSSTTAEASAALTATRKRKGKFTPAHRGSKLEMCKKNTAQKEEHITTVIASAKRKLRKPTMTAALSLQRSQSNMARRNRAMGKTEKKEPSKQPVPKPSTKKSTSAEKKAVESDASHKAGTNHENKPPVATTDDVPVVAPAPHQGPMDFLCGGELKVSNLSISVHCFNNEYLKTTSRSLTLLSHAQPINVLADALSQSTIAKKTSFANGEWLKLIRQRKWDLLCPSVVVKRSMEVVSKMILLENKAAKAKRKLRYHRKHRKLTLEQLAKRSSTSAKPRSPKPGPPPPPTAAFRPPSHPVPTPSPFALSRPPTGDIPLPDNIPILPSEGMLEDDINWKELSDFLESNDEESMTALPPPISQYGPPPCPQQPHPQPIDHIHFDDHRFGPRHIMHPPYIPPHPGHLHIPPPHLHPPPPGPHTPLMSPFTPDMRPPDMPPPPPPDGYYSPMMGPEGFIPTRGIGPDGGGYSSPMTPQRGYPPPSVMGPMEFQHSPGHPHPHHHHHGGHFPMPSPRINFPPPPPPPPRQSFPGPPHLPPSKKLKGSGNSNGSMAKMVSKMKMKTPSAPKQKKHLSPKTPNGEPQQVKKRRSPGYSEAGWRCRCGTNNVMFPNKVCAKGKCPCYTKGVACKNCLCRHCHNPFGTREIGVSLREVTAAGTQDVDAGTQDGDAGTEDVEAGAQDVNPGTRDANAAGTQDVNAGAQEVSMDTQEVIAGAQDGSSSTQEVSESSPTDTVVSE